MGNYRQKLRLLLYRTRRRLRHIGSLSVPAVTRAGEVRDPLDMHALLDADLWYGMLYEEQFSWQATMFQPVGGMDRIPAAFEKRLERMIRFQSPVQQIRKSPKGVHVTYRDLKSGAHQSIDAHYCICTLPFSILKDLDTDLSPDLKQIINATNYDAAYKIAWESPRFWEREYSIYGGISFLDQPVNHTMSMARPDYSQPAAVSAKECCRMRTAARRAKWLPAGRSGRPQGEVAARRAKWPSLISSGLDEGRP